MTSMQGISPDCFFAGVCCGGLITLPIQVSLVLLDISQFCLLAHTVRHSMQYFTLQKMMIYCEFPSI